MNPYLQEILHNITTRLAALEDKQKKKEWVGLTKEEVENWNLPEGATVFEFVQFVEAKLKEKNND